MGALVRFGAVGLAVGLLATGCQPGCPDTRGSICTWSGTGERAFEGDGEHRTVASYYWPMDIAFAPDDRMYILDWNNHRVRRINADQKLETVIGTMELMYQAQRVESASFRAAETFAVTTLAYLTVSVIITAIGGLYRRCELIYV